MRLRRRRSAAEVEDRAARALSAPTARTTSRTMMKCRGAKKTANAAFLPGESVGDRNPSSPRRCTYRTDNARIAFKRILTTHVARVTGFECLQPGIDVKWQRS